MIKGQLPPNPEYASLTANRMIMIMHITTLNLILFREAIHTINQVPSKTNDKDTAIIWSTALKSFKANNTPKIKTAIVKVNIVGKIIVTDFGELSFLYSQPQYIEESKMIDIPNKNQENFK